MPSFDGNEPIFVDPAILCDPEPQSFLKRSSREMAYSFRHLIDGKFSPDTQS
jgi:hypothetical protein